MESIFDVAKFILHEKGTMSTMKLQKLCYYSQAWFLAREDREMFPEDFEDWSEGAVCRKLFYAHQRRRYISENDITVGNIATIEILKQQAILWILKHYGDYEAMELSRLNHAEAPWLITRGNIPVGVKDDKIIEKSLMKEYYANIDKLNKIAKLEPNWDGEDGATFEVAFLNVIKQLLNTIPKQPFITPAGNGSIFLEYGSTKPHNNYLGFEIFNDLSVRVIKRNADENCEEKTIRLDEINEWVSEF